MRRNTWTDWPIFYRNPIPYPLKHGAPEEGCTAMILRNPPSGLRLHDLFLPWYATTHTRIETMNRAPVTIAKWSTCASTWTVWPLLKRYVRPRAVYTYPCICLTLTYQPLFLPISRPNGKKSEGKRVREREEEGTGGRPVCAVAAGYSGSRHWFRSTVYFVEPLVAKESAIHEKWC